MERGMQVKVATVPSASQNPTRPFKGYGSFKIEAGKLLTRRIVTELATVMERHPRFMEKVEQDDDPGLFLLNELEQEGKISSTNINYLIKCLADRAINRHGLKDGIMTIFHENCLNEDIGEETECDKFQDGERAVRVRKLTDNETECDDFQDDERAVKVRKLTDNGEKGTCDVFIVQTAETGQSEPHLLSTSFDKITFLAYGLKGRQRIPVLLYATLAGGLRMKLETFQSYTLRNYHEVPSEHKMFITPFTEISQSAPGYGFEIFLSPELNPVMAQVVTSKLSPICRVLEMESGTVVSSVKGVLVKIRLLRTVDFLTSGTILILKDAGYSSLAAVVDEDIQSTLQLCAGNVIEVKRFMTKKSQRGNSSCYLLSVSESSIRNVKDRQLRQIATQLPTVRSYQIRGICKYIQTIRYEACSQDTCGGNQLRNPDMDRHKMMSCPRCGNAYPPPVQKLGWFIRVRIDDGTKKSFQGSRIIGKKTVMEIFKKLGVSISLSQYKMQSKFKEIFDKKKVRAIVGQVSDRRRIEIVSDLMIVPNEMHAPSSDN